MSKRSPYSLRRRLLVWLLIPLFAIEVFALAHAYQSARKTANEVYDRVLAGSVLAIAERVFVNEEGNLEVDIPYIAFDMLSSAAQDRIFYRLEGPSKKFVTGYDKLILPVDTKSNGKRFFFSDSKFRGSNIRISIYQGTASNSEKSTPFRIAVAETTNARNTLTRDILINSAIRQISLIIAAAIIVWFAVTRSLVPLKKLEAAISRRSSDDLRPIHHDVPSEVQDLVNSFNNFIERLSKALSALRHFTGNASHQIRTPLTIIRTQLALAQRSQELGNVKGILNNCDNAVIDAERVLSQLLLLARIDSSSSNTIDYPTVNITKVAKDATQANVIRAAKAGLDLGFEGEGCIFSKVDSILFRELVNNLIDNAIKHAKGGSYITVRVRDNHNHAFLEVEDNGCGIPEKLHELALNRFVTTSNTTSENSGLGLSIVSEITQLFSGSLRMLSYKESKGLFVEVRFPLVIINS